MTDSLVPDWIKEMKEEENSDTAARNAVTAEEALADKTIQADGPTFWKQLRKELKINVDSLGVIGLRGSMSDFQTPAEGQQGCQIQISRESLSPESRWLNLFYTPGESAIQCCPQVGRCFPLQLCFRRGQVLVWSDGRALSAEDTAKAIVRPIAKMLLGKEG